MGLTQYKKKRDLKKTPEPSGGTIGKKKDLIFVVQRHKATSLHYDFRLEMEGVLKSWAVPKGPSLNPKDKRLAMMVEDHPLDYASFEGIIPEHNYGAGIVEIWDEGIYEEIAEKYYKKAEKKLLNDLKKGSLKFVLKGEKLKGEFALVKMKGDVKGNAWLLIKHKDEFAVTKEYSSEDQTEADSPINIALKNKFQKVKKNSSTNHSSLQKRNSKSRYVTPGKKIENYIKPMLAKTTDKVFSDPDWLFEIKWDGYRAIAEIDKKEVKLYSRNGISFAEKYAPVTEELKKLSTSMILDGEIVFMDKDNFPSFQGLQDYANNGKIEDDALYYYVFDLLFHKGKDLRKKPLLERKKLLKAALKDGIIVRYCDHVLEDGKDFFKLVSDKDLEGIMAKKADSIYLSGKRTDKWLKIKNHRTEEVIIAGYTKPEGSRKYFGSLILGVYNNDVLQYVGHSGTGFTDKKLKKLFEKMKPLKQDKSPFKEKVPVNNPPTWLKPKLVCNIKFTEWTKDGVMRHPVFQGLRMDKSEKEVTRENKNTGSMKMHDKIITVSKIKLKITNLDKVFWPEEKITKGDVIDYYNTMSKYVLPYLKNRPQSLKRNPNGILDEGFYHKDAGDDAPDWVDTKKIKSESTGQDVNYILCNNKPTLIYLNNLGCIELNPWNSRIEKPGHPDYLIMDIDPSEKNDYDDVVEVALAIKRILDKAGADAYCKTSGATGMHIYVPLGAKYNYEQARTFAELIARMVQEELPEISTLERSLKKRKKDKIYIDYLQNSRGQTLACAYSLRPRPGATVSTPLKWKEVKRGLRPDGFNIHTIPERIVRTGDLFREVLKKGIDLKKCLAALESK